MKHFIEILEHQELKNTTYKRWTIC